MMHNTAEQEKALFVAIRQGDLIAFERFLFNHEKRLFHVILSIVHQRQEAEDVTQEAFVKFFLFRAKIDEQKNPAALLYRIGKNIALDSLRKRAGAQLAAYEELIDGSSVSLLRTSAASSIDARIDIDRALKKMKPIHARVATLFFIDGYSYEDIAQMIHIPLNTVKTYLHRARRALKKELLYQPQ